MYPIYLWAWNRSFVLAPLLACGILFVGGWRADVSVRKDMRYALLDASADLSLLLLNLQATQAFSSEQILKLSEDEIQRSQSSWAPISSQLFLQVIDRQNKLQYDSRTRKVSGVKQNLPPAANPRFGQLRRGGPWLYVDNELTPNWLLRIAISVRHYLKRQILHFLTWSLPLALVIVGMLLFPHYYQEAVDRRQSELVIKAMLAFRGPIKTEEEVLTELLRVTRMILGFDAAAIYLLQGSEIVLRAIDSAPENRAGPIPQLSTSKPIAIDSSTLEARAVRENRSFIVDSRSMLMTGDRPQLGPPGEAPYLLSPICSSQARQALGFFWAYKRLGLEKRDLESLDELAPMAAVLIENARFAEGLREVINLTRQVALGTVVPIIAHNMRTPLTMMSLIARDIQEKAPSMDPTRLRKLLSQIESQSSQCLSLIDKIVRFRSMGHRPADWMATRQRLDLVEALTKVFEFFESYFQVRQLALALEIEDGFRPKVMIDELDLLQVITNMLINCDEAFPARDRVGAGYKVLIRVEPSIDPPGALIHVVDNGPGVPPEIRSTIFNEHTTTKLHGTGAGLAYCRRVIENAGGTLELGAENVPGASFVAFFPTEGR